MTDFSEFRGDEVGVYTSAIAPKEGEERGTEMLDDDVVGGEFVFSRE
jgi:hypothetical protein